MRPEAGQTGGVPDHLTVVRSLITEIEAAISALVRGELQQFEEHVSRQEALCACLNHLVAEGSLPASAQAAGNAEFQTKADYLRLAKMGSLYAGLLARCQRSFSLLAALYRGYGVAYNLKPLLPAANPSLSCEI